MKVRDLLIEDSSVIFSKNDQENFFLIVENISKEIQELTSDSIGKPYASFKSKQTSDLSNKLRNWAVRVLKDLIKKPSSLSNKKYISILNKIIDNPRDAAKQIFSSVMTKTIEKEKNENIRKPEGFDFWFSTISSNYKQ